MIFSFILAILYFISSNLGKTLYFGDYSHRNTLVRGHIGGVSGGRIYMTGRHVEIDGKITVSHHQFIEPPPTLKTPCYELDELRLRFTICYHIDR
jgi:hypothetical protein